MHRRCEHDRNRKVQACHQQESEMAVAIRVLSSTKMGLNSKANETSIRKFVVCGLELLFTTGTGYRRMSSNVNVFSRMASTRSLGSAADAEPEVEPNSAAGFLMSSARMRLTEALSSGADV